MSKVSFTNLKLKLEQKTKEFDYSGNKIEVLQYLPLEDKYSLINITLQNAKEGVIYNEALLDSYFHLYIVMMYTNINFTDKQKEDLLKLYDLLNSNGIISLVLANMDEKEYNTLRYYLNEQTNKILKYQNTLYGAISNLFESIPTQAEEIQKIVDNFDKEKFQNVLDFAKSVNNGNLPK